jgi:diguanylate cyclase (GGDEF)-like protein
MKFRLVYFVFLTLFVFFIICSAIILDKTSNTPLLIITGLLLLLTLFVEGKIPRTIYVPLVLLFLSYFHWLSHLNWCHTLYWIILIRPLYRTVRLLNSFVIAFLLTLQYSFIRLSYVTGNSYDILVSITDIFTAAIIVLFVRYIKNSETEKNHLLTHDPLTDLMNFQEYHKQVDNLISEKKAFVHVLIDYTNFKALNEEHGMIIGNEKLKKIAQFLKTSFGDEKLISRYQGTQFAVSLPYQANTQVEIPYILTSTLENLGDLKFIFSYTIYPDEANNLSDLFLHTEEKLYRIKRQNWLKKEEDLLRTEKLSVIGELAAGMAHEIRNPLTTIKGFLQIAKNNEYNIKPWYEVIEGEVLRMNELTAEFLQFSKPHIANVKVHNLEDCIQRVMHLTGSEAVFSGHLVQYNKSQSSVFIEMDKDKIVQVLLNLVKNGLEAMKENGIITIRLMIDEQDHYAIVEIEDTGKGISETEISQIFNPFYTTKNSGTGLGLSICHKIIQDHHGKIEVHSILNKGTTFRIYLPRMQQR